MFPPQRGSNLLWARMCPCCPDPHCTPSEELQFLLAALSHETGGLCKQAAACSRRTKGGFGFFPSPTILSHPSTHTSSLKLPHLSKQAREISCLPHATSTNPFQPSREHPPVSVSSSWALRGFGKDGNKEINVKFDFFFKPRPFIFAVFLHGIPMQSPSQSCHVDCTALPS